MVAEAARRSPGRAATRRKPPAEHMSLPERRPSRPVRSPVRTRKITNHGGEGPFAPAVPVHSTVYFTQAPPPPPSSDGTYFELVQAILVALVIIATAMAVISSTTIETPTMTGGFVPLQQRGVVWWAWAALKNLVWD
jgi:hypothetical protein